MRRKITSILVVTAILLSSWGGIAGASQENCQYFKELPADSQGFALIKLDTEVMQNCQDSFTDIRFTDHQGREIASQPASDRIIAYDWNNYQLCVCHHICD